MLPAAIAAINPHPAVTVQLNLFDDLDQCTYRCPTAGGTCTTSTYELVSCASGATPGDVYPGVDAVELSIDVDGSIPSSHGLISATAGAWTSSTRGGAI